MNPCTLFGALHDVGIPAAASGPQRAKCYVPPACRGGDVVPLLVALHPWSADYAEKRYADQYAAEAERLQVALVHPDFRGPNTNPGACASDPALDDIGRAVAFMEAYAPIDKRRICLIGVSGGGHMALMAAARYPRIWAGVSAWVPITDLAAWHRQSRERKNRYEKDLEAVCGGAPGSSKKADEAYAARSPLYRLREAAHVMIDINAGIRDGHTGSVPISHSLNAFNALADANGMPEKKLSQAEIDRMTEEEDPAGIAGETADDGAEARRYRTLFRRSAGTARVSVFDGGHDIDVPAAVRWLLTCRLGGAPAEIP